MADPKEAGYGIYAAYANTPESQKAFDHLIQDAANATQVGIAVDNLTKGGATTYLPEPPGTPRAFSFVGLEGQYQQIFQHKGTFDPTRGTKLQRTS